MIIVIIIIIIIICIYCTFTKFTDTVMWSDNYQTLHDISPVYGLTGA